MKVKICQILYYETNIINLKSLKIENNIWEIHSAYAILLQNKFNNINIAEYYYKMALKIEPNNANIC